MLDYAPVFQDAIPEDIDTKVTARWVDGSYYLTSKVLSLFSASDVDTVEASSMEELVENEELAESGLGVLTSAFAANPMGALLQAPAIENLQPAGDRCDRGHRRGRARGRTGGRGGARGGLAGRDAAVHRHRRAHPRRSRPRNPSCPWPTTR